MSWTKTHSELWLYGSIRELSPEVRSVWHDLQALADLSIKRGVICIADGIGYTRQQLADLFKIKVVLLDVALVEFERLKYLFCDEKNIIVLLQWSEYQSEYQRLKKYRKGTKKGTPKGTR